MRKYMAFVLACICMMMLVACNNDSTSVDNEYAFNAKVLEVGEQYLLVEPESDSNEFNSADKIRILLGNVNYSENLEVGDSVIIVYDGMIQELYPAMIPNVRSIKKN